MNGNRKFTMSMLAAGLATAGLLGVPALASAQESAVTPVYADLDGDGRADLVTVTALSENQYEIVADLGYTTVQAVVGDGDTPLAPEQPRVLDLDADGTSELAAMSYLGANAFSWSVFSYSPDAGLAQVGTDSGEPLRLPDGGGSAGPSGYTCTGDQPGERLLWTTDGSLDVQRSTPEAPVYNATRAAYRVQDGVATQVEQSAAEGASQAWLEQQRNSAACGTLGAG